MKDKDYKGHPKHDDRKKPKPEKEPKPRPLGDINSPGADEPEPPDDDLDGDINSPGRGGGG